MPSREVGSSGRNLLTFELELHDIAAAIEPAPSLLITTRWTPKEPQPADPAAQLIVRYASLEVRYVPSRSKPRPARRAQASAPWRVGDLSRPASVVGVSTAFHPGAAEPDDDSIGLGIAQLAAEQTQYSPAWFSSGFG